MKSFTACRFCFFAFNVDCYSTKAEFVKTKMTEYLFTVFLPHLVCFSNIFTLPIFVESSQVNKV